MLYLVVERLLKDKFNILAHDSTLIKSNVTLLGLYNHIYNLYSGVYQHKGLVGIYNLRKNILYQIRTLKIPAPSKKSKSKENGMITERLLKKSYSDLLIYKDILTKIRFSMELFTSLYRSTYYNNSFNECSFYTSVRPFFLLFN